MRKLSLELVLGSFAWVEEIFIGKLVLQLGIGLLEAQSICHELSNDPHVCLPLLFSFLLMMLEEVVIR